MKRIVTIASCLSLVLTSGAMAGIYSWSVSLSSTNADVHTGAPGGPLTTTTFRLWLSCTALDGAAAAALHADVAGGAAPGAFVPLSFVLNAGDGTDLQLAIGGCPDGPVMIGSWDHVNTDGTGISVCLAPGGLTVDCDPITPTLFPHTSRGATTIPADTPCTVGDYCIPPDATEPASWGSIKGLYR